MYGALRRRIPAPRERAPPERGWRGPLLLQDRRPVPITGFDALRDVLGPLRAHGRVVIEIELAIDDAPRVGLGLDGIAFARAERAVAAILRRVFRRLGLERIAVDGAGEMPLGALPIEAELRVALHRLFLGEIGDGVVAVDGHALVGENFRLL